MNIFIFRARIISIFLLFFSFIILFKIYTLQIIKHDLYSDLADRQYAKKSGMVHDRGDIFFTKKDNTHTLAADMKEVYTLFINNKAFFAYINSNNKNIQEEISKLENDLSRILNNKLNNKFNEISENKNDVYNELLKDIDEEMALKIIDYKKQNKYNFLGVIKNKKRHYPGTDLASHVLGFVGFKGDEFAGRYGLERSYENNLKREEKAYTNMFVDIFSNAKKVIDNKSELEADIYTTIEPVVQRELQKNIKKIQLSENSELTGAIIMNPNNGEIYALAQYPNFEGANRNDIKDISIYSNDMIESSHEMGSIIKPLTMAVGLDTGKIKADTKYDDKGFVKVYDRTMYNFDKKARGMVDMQTALVKSLNTGFVYIADKVGEKTLRDYFYKFGMNQKTNIDLPNESAPLVSNLEKGPVEAATASFGQGIAMSPIGTIRALSVLANNGYLINPHIVKRIDYNFLPDKIIDNDIKGEKVLKDESIEAVKKMMVYNIDKSLLEGKRKKERYSIAAKTGTAQIANPNGGYFDNKNMHTFIGFFPAKKPEFIIFMYTIYPKKSKFSSESLASPFMDIVDFLIGYYEVKPDR